MISPWCLLFYQPFLLTCNYIHDFSDNEQTITCDLSSASPPRRRISGTNGARIHTKRTCDPRELWLKCESKNADQLNSTRPFYLNSSPGTQLNTLCVSFFLIGSADQEKALIIRGCTYVCVCIPCTPSIVGMKSWDIRTR